MEFYNEKEKKIDNHTLEVTEQQLAKQYIEPDDVVLELGARYGSVSCAINKNLNNPFNQVSVEPDDRVWKALEDNRTRNDCKFHIVKGFISNIRLSLTNLNEYHGGYAATYFLDSESTINHYTLKDIECMYNLKFNTLVADCEGYLGEFLIQNPELYDNIKKFIFEADYPDKCNYEIIRDKLLEKGFECKLYGHQNVFLK